MNFEFTENGWEEFEYWIETDSSIVEKIKDLLKEIKKTPFQGIGKPEPVKYDLKGYCSMPLSLRLICMTPTIKLKIIEMNKSITKNSFLSLLPVLKMIFFPSCGNKNSRR